VIDRLTTGQIPKLRDVVPEAPEQLDAICRRALAPNPADRYSHASEMRDAIDAYVNTLGQRPTVNDIGKSVTALFEAERAEIRSIIERRLSGLDPHEDTDLGHGDDDEDTGSIPLLVTGIGAANRTPSHASASGRGIARTASVTMTRRSSSSWLLAIALLVAAAAAVIVWINVRPRPAAPVAAVAGVPPEPPRAESDEAKTNLLLAVHAKPEATKIYVDGTLVSENPYRAKFARDGIAHRIRAEAPGYIGESKIVVFDQDHDLVFELKPRPDAAASAEPKKPERPRYRPTPPPKPAASPSKPEQPSSPNLDVDPWAK
jgi:serine/threonine-protein kinase